jgi:uncharacterized membrane protein HdeD (DUF308 family)
MFTDGQKIFAILFIVAFIVIISYQFYKDRQRNKTLFKGTYWVLISIFGIILGYIILTKFLH